MFVMFWDIFIHILFLYYFLFCFYSPLFSFLFSILSLYMSLYLDDSLDDSWLNIQNKFDKLYYDNTESIKEPIESISLMCIYVSTDSCIQHVSKNVVMIDPSGVISKDSFFHIIQDKRCFENKKYKLDDVLSFHVDLEHSNLKAFVDSSNNVGFLKSISYMNPIECPPSLFCFHDLASLYLIFIEQNEIKSIMKNDSSKRVTKKVRIIEPKNSCSRKFLKKLKRTLRTLS